MRELAPYGQPDAPPKLAGRNLNVMLSPLPRAKRAPNPHQGEPAPEDAPEETADADESSDAASA